MDLGHHSNERNASNFVFGVVLTMHDSLDKQSRPDPLFPICYEFFK